MKIECGAKTGAERSFNQNNYHCPLKINGSVAKIL